MRVIAGSLRGKKLLSADKEVTRPTADRAKEGLFNILNHLLLTKQKGWNDIVFVDVFAGSGAVGIEAFSRGAKEVILFEQDKSALSFLTKNIQNLPIQVVRADACFPPIRQKKADILFFDPPYGKGLWQKALPNFFKQGWIDSNTLIIIESDSALKEEVPTSYCLLREQHYGRNRFLFLTTKEG